jgi:hypothetical protein
MGNKAISGKKSKSSDSKGVGGRSATERFGINGELGPSEREDRCFFGTEAFGCR